MYRMLWVRIPALHTGWTFSHLFGVKIVEKTKISKKEAGNGPLKNKSLIVSCSAEDLFRLCSLKQVGRQTIIEAT